MARKKTVKEAVAAAEEIAPMEAAPVAEAAGNSPADSDGGDGDDGYWDVPEGPEGPGPGDEHLSVCALEPETDIGNGRRLLHRHQDKLLNVANRGVHVFDGKRWAWDETDALARRHCHDTVERISAERELLTMLPHERAIIDEAEATAGELKQLRGLKSEERTGEQTSRLAALAAVEARAFDARKALATRKAARARHAKSSCSTGKLDNMLREAVPYITRTLEEMDADPLALNCQNGTLRFVQHKDAAGGRAIWDIDFKPHAREDLISKCCDAEWDPNAACPTFEAFLDQMQPEDETRAFVQRYLGYSITGLTHEQVFAFFHGGGRNGKSTMVDIVCRILADYSTTVPIETLAGEQRRKGGDATPDLMRLPGARIVRASEPESNMKLREAMVKSLTSDEPILIRALHKDFTEVYPSFKLIVSGNHKPRIDNDDNGIWRRVLLVPWDVKLEKEQVDRMLGRKLWEERNGILAWLVRGALSYLEEGLKVPALVQAATDEYRTESNPIGAFLDAFCLFTNETFDRLQPGEVFEIYDLARNDQGWPQFLRTTFVKRLPEQIEARGGARIKSNGLKYYVGIKLNEDAMEMKRAASRDRYRSSSAEAFT